MTCVVFVIADGHILDIEVLVSKLRSYSKFLIVNDLNREETKGITQNGAASQCTKCVQWEENFILMNIPNTQCRNLTVKRDICRNFFVLSGLKSQ
jgi:hypothetical protein